VGEENVEDLWLAFYWTGPIGVGGFLAGLGVLFWGISRLQDSDRRKKEAEKQQRAVTESGKQQAAEG
jgi:hypothetical protein